MSLGFLQDGVGRLVDFGRSYVLGAHCNGRNTNYDSKIHPLQNPEPDGCESMAGGSRKVAPSAALTR